MGFHAAEEGELMCTVCKTDFDEKASLIRHLKVHAGARSIKDTERNQKCPYPTCDKVFFTRKDVRRHMVVHTKDRDFLCQYCPQRFGRRDHLVRHLKKAHALEAAADGLKGVLLDESIDGTSPNKSKKRGRVPQPGPSEETMDRRLEGHSLVVSELLQTVAKSMSEMPTTPVKSENIVDSPKKRLLERQQVILAQQPTIIPTKAGNTQYITIQASLDPKAVPLQIGTIDGQVTLIQPQPTSLFTTTSQQQQPNEQQVNLVSSEI